jgi:putative ABC transport system ATP-binding protein
MSHQPDGHDGASVAGQDRVGVDSSDGASVVAARDVTRRYGEDATAVDALRGVSLQVRPGELVAVMGPSGSGKSTLMHTMAGLDKPTTGSVEIAGEEITDMDDAKLTQLRRDHVGFVFQFFNLLPMLSAEENVVLPLTIAGEHADREWLEELLERTGLQRRRAHRPAELSGGEQQRVAVARALVTRPTILFADEPTGNLDSKTSGEILELLRASVRDYGQTIVMVTHDPRGASIADRILFLADGLIVKEMRDANVAQVLEVMSTLE